MVHSVTSPETHGLLGNGEINMGSKSVYLRQYVTRLCACESVEGEGRKGREGKSKVSLLSVPDPKPTSAWDHFQFPCVILQAIHAPDEVWGRD